jgi:hypothetical protein
VGLHRAVTINIPQALGDRLSDARRSGPEVCSVQKIEALHKAHPAHDGERPLDGAGERDPPRPPGLGFDDPWIPWPGPAHSTRWVGGRHGREAMPRARAAVY